MTHLVLPWIAVLLTVPLLAGLRLLVTGADVGWRTICLHLAFQAGITAAVIWVTSLLGPLNAQTLYLTAGGLALETGYRFYRRWIKG